MLLGRNEILQFDRVVAALVQMRSGLAPQVNLDAAIRLIGEAKDGGADYVLTPEMTNILEVKRERLFATIVPEESDATLAALRELARKLGIEAESALRDANVKFDRRFRYVEARAKDEDVPLAEAGLDRLDSYWNEIRAKERSGGV